MAQGRAENFDQDPTLKTDLLKLIICTYDKSKYI